MICTSSPHLGEIDDRPGSARGKSPDTWHVYASNHGRVGIVVPAEKRRLLAQLRADECLFSGIGWIIHHHFVHATGRAVALSRTEDLRLYFGKLRSVTL